MGVGGAVGAAAAAPRRAPRADRERGVRRRDRWRPPDRSGRARRVALRCGVLGRDGSRRAAEPLVVAAAGRRRAAAAVEYARVAEGAVADERRTLLRCVAADGVPPRRARPVRDQI